MPRSHVRGLLLLGVVFHAVYVLSIFDIYFTSPIVPHIESLVYTAAAPAKRMVVFVADGCRADKFFEHNATATDSERVSFLRDVVERRGSWGVSHTRVPTESRPGHVALFAGMYEDVSAVTKGWQDNPVDFDSVFNQSQRAWLFGSPDIVPMFARRVPHATERHYSHEEEDFAAKDASQLDVWVYDHVRKLLFEDAAANATLDAQLRGEQVVFFCHFLGIDTNGHAHRPNSADYLNNIALVDELVEKTTRLIDEFYGYDGRTAFVFTADHGMSNKGAHGDGDPTNTRTPLVVWGAGVAGPERVVEPQEQIDLPTQSRDQVQAQLLAQQEQERIASQQWGLGHLIRKDVMQADVAPLISSLLGLPYPRNSVGVLPFSYLAAGAYRTTAVVSNAQQLHLHAKRKEQEKEARTLLLFRPYSPFRSELPQLMAQMLAAGDALADAEAVAQRVIAICLDTLEYFQRYDWLFLFSVIVAGYVGWIAFLAIAYKAPTATRRDFHALEALCASCGGDGGRFALLSLVVAVFLALESSPLSYFVYVAFPLVFWHAVWRHRHALLSTTTTTTTAASVSRRSWLQALWVICSLELVVLGYNNRWIFGVVFLLLALWPALDEDTEPMTAAVSIHWSLACVALAVFPFLPTEAGEDTALVLVGGVAVMALAHTAGASKMRVLVVLLAMLGVHVTMGFLSSKAKPPESLTAFNWLTALVPIALQITSGGHTAQSHGQQLVHIALALAPAYIVLSISYEVLFYAALTVVLLAWLAMEEASRGQSTWHDLRRAFFFLVLIQIAFFGTGNVASMSSFEISSTYRFVTVFSPFLMAALLVGKILIPFLLVACAFVMVLQRRQETADPSRYFLLVVAMSDALALQFLFLVRNEGSWKEIGNSISMYGIVNAQIVFVPLLFLAATRLAGQGPLKPLKSA